MSKKKFTRKETTNKKGLKSGAYPISRMIPNVVTMTAICFGLTSIRYALDQKWEICVILIIMAGILDVIDGRLARALNASSVFGAHLDSLSDFINFGVAPAVTLYLWGLHSIDIRGLGWGIVLFYSISCAIRLARFNTDMFDNTMPEWKESFFVGVPAPASAYLAMIPMMISFQVELNFAIFPYLLGLYTLIVAFLMASKIPTFSTKKIKVSKENVPFILIGMAIVIILTIIEPWIVLIFIGIAYLLLVPFGIKSYNNKKNKAV